MTPKPTQPQSGRRPLALSVLVLLFASPLAAQDARPTTAVPSPEAERAAAKEQAAVKVAIESEPAAPKQDEIVTLSPFLVQQSSKDIGYFAENTLAGSRLNTKISDLGSSITVVTKQQMVDTGSVNINDVFMYEASTEGANTFTQTDVSRNGIPRDTIAGYSSDQGDPSTRNTANRVRGLAAPDSAQNNYPSISRIPFDAYNTNTLEISRGPNSLLFGTGSPAGIVNQSTAQAVLNKQQTHVEARVGSWSDEREAFSHNQPLIEDKLSIYVAALQNSTGFRRKPSADLTHRQYGAITFQPFKKTRLTASIEHYRNFSNAPNSQTPRDYVSEWLRAGRPGYDPLTRSVTIMDSGAVIGPYVTSTASPGYTAGMIVGNPAITQAPTATVPNAQYIPGIQFGVTGSARTAVYTNQGQVLYTTAVTGTPFTTLVAPYTAYNAPAAGSRTPAQWMVADRRLTSSIGPVAPAGYGGWIQPASTNKAIYDYEHINLLQMNYGDYDGRTYNVELQQEILPNLNFSAGWFRQLLTAVENYTVSNANAITTIYVDTNINNIDGSPNPYFGSPFLADISPDTFKTPETNDNFRAMLAYDLDLTQEKGFLRFLGHHRLVGLWSDQEAERSTFRYRNTFDGGDIRYQANPATAGAIIANSGITRVFYVGQDKNGVVQYAPGRLGQPGYGGPDESPVRTYNWSTGQWENSTLHMSQQLFYAGAYGLIQKNIAGKSFAITSSFWDDRIVTTFGWRKDDYKARQTNVNGLTTADLYVNGIAIDPGWTYHRLTDWYRLSGTTRTAGAVVKPYRWRSGELQFHYNQSDNFNPPSGIPIDFYGTPLPKSTGDGKDYGVGITAFDGKLVARLNWFTSTNENALATAATTAIGRVSRMDTSSFRSWADYVVRIRNGQDPTNANFANNTVFPLTTAMKNEIAALMQVPSYDNWPPANINGTQTNEAKGEELQLIYNPKRNWNIKLTASKIKATYQDVAPQIDAWVGDANTQGTRMYVWQHATAPDMPALITLSNGTPVSLQNFWTGYGFNADVRLSNATSSNPSWTSSRGFYEAAVATEINVAKALQGKTVPNDRELQYSIISNYAFEDGKLRGVAIGGGWRWAQRAIAGFYGDATKKDSSGNIVASDLARPIYVPAEGHLDLWASYSRKVFNNKAVMKIQVNIRDALENGKLQPIAFNLDGSAFAYRIIDPRQWYASTSFDF
ncbi:MAG: TonB-dependent receptor plug domain-containing protein [Verrucomicrobia bacterium]|nr:TonB-dependent receptor plug domain-containing protein [Verrucomicrobiota bacterium]